MKRINSIDIVRGIVMVIMALDHVRDLMHVTSITQSPTDLSTTTPILFFTRWITYLCAPIFVFLAGTSAYISFKKKNDIPGSRSFLIKRGIYLIVLDLLVVNLILFFDPLFHTILFEVIATIGFGFIILGLLLKASSKAIGLLGLLIICCHNLLPLVPFPENSVLKAIIAPLFGPGAFPFSNKVLVMAYPPIPWLGIMLVGFAAGRYFEWAEEKRKQLFIKMGVIALLLFVLIRFINLYGDPAPWAYQKSGMFTFLSFMNVTKYPPSLQFCLVTLGIMFLMLAFTEGALGKLSGMISVYGRVPLFYFLVHFLLIHCLMVALMFLQGFSPPQLDFASGTFGRPKGVQSGVNLGLIYIIWMGVVLSLYQPCAWFGRYKQNGKQWWLKYM
ncbi:MAG TPA: heparan-alpha-glucosaminide N-acetyltransferase domain-containing protein [Chitinophagaceae bacterium]|nr:heparan-alpha-glucosaminide N-acetyltransferase domain-containing protein [Chitinophagaceae bacterium]